MVRKLASRILIVLLSFVSCVYASDLNVAVTSSFKPVLDRVAPLFYETTGIQLNISAASTGVLTQQIISGAPFDLFFSADKQRPSYVVETLSLPVERQQLYATGKLVLVSQNGRYKSVSDLNGYNQRLVIAHPDHAPYGVAALQALANVEFQGDLVLANNVVQARQYLSLNLAPAGLIAASVAAGFDSVFDVDPLIYEPIEHHLVILQATQNTQALVTFFASDAVKNILIELGYEPAL